MNINVTLLNSLYTYCIKHLKQAFKVVVVISWHLQYPYTWQPQISKAGPAMCKARRSSVSHSKGSTNSSSLHSIRLSLTMVAVAVAGAVAAEVVAVVVAAAVVVVGRGNGSIGVGVVVIEGF